MLKKFMALTLSVILVFSMGVSAFANTNENGGKEKILVAAEYVEVEVDGEVYQVKINEYRYRDPASSRAINPEAEVGDTSEVEVEITNQMLGLPSVITGTVSLTPLMKQKAAQIVAGALAERFGASFIPGVGAAAIIMGAVAWVNAQAGYDGFLFTVELEYISMFLHKEGHYIYGWDITDVDMSGLILD